MSHEIPLPPLLPSTTRDDQGRPVWTAQFLREYARAHEDNVRAALQPPPDAVLDMMDECLRDAGLNPCPDAVAAADAIAALRRQLKHATDGMKSWREAAETHYERAEKAERERDTYKSLYDAKSPLHERRKWPSVMTETTFAEAEGEPVMLFQQSFWPDCQCVECYAAHKAEEFYRRAVNAERELAAARQEIEALKPDAERYRWLRCHSWKDALHQDIHFGEAITQTKPESVDAAIDAARAK